MFLFPRAASVPAALVRSAPIASSVHLLSLPAARNAENATNLNGNGTISESRQSSLTSTTTTRTGLPTLLILVIVVAALFVLSLTTLLGYWEFRKWRDRRKRSKHHEQKLKFQDMASKGMRPDWGPATATAAPIPVSFPSSYAYAQDTLPTPPLVPNRAYAV